MEQITATFFLAFILILLSLLGLGIGWWVTGRSKLRSCGMRQKEEGKSCGKNISCSLCGKDKQPTSQPSKKGAEDDNTDS